MRLCSPRVMPGTESAARIAGRLARAGALVVYPTDTVYGVGCNPLIEYCVWRVFRAKRRPPTRPVPVLVSSMEAAERIAHVTPEARRLMEAFWPGPLTIVLPAKPGLPGIVHAGTGTVGVRMPRHKLALKLIEEAGGLIIGTSANIHRQPPPVTVEEAVRQLGCDVDLYLDGGRTPGGKPSTVVSLADGRPRVLREGPIGLEEILRVLG